MSESKDTEDNRDPFEALKLAILDTWLFRQIRRMVEWLNDKLTKKS